MRFVLHNNLFKLICKLLEIFDRSIRDKYSTEIFNISNTAQSYVNIHDKYTVQIFSTNIPQKYSGQLNRNNRFFWYRSKLGKYSLEMFNTFIILFFSFSFKELLQSITCTKEATVKFMLTNSITSINYPGPLVNGRRVYGCGKPMQLKRTNDSKDGYVWRCRKVHKIVKNCITYTVKDAKLSI